jgi:hypothetical protein
MNRPARPLSRKKKILFRAAAVLLALPVAEAASWFAINDFFNESLDTYRESQKQLAGSGVALGSCNETIHPYLGWVMNPDVDPGLDLGGRHVPVNRFGFLDDEWDFPRRSERRLIVGILGGSVAWQMSVLGETALRETLADNPVWRDREIRLVRIAMPGYKQPQTLMALNYLLALGAEFDVIVNIDGYNEIALAAGENDGSVFAAYPRSWNARTQDIVDPRVFALSFHVLEARAARQELARNIRGSGLAWSPTVNLIWSIRDKLWQNRFVELGDELRRSRASLGIGFASAGPPQLYAGKSEMYGHLRDVWRNCTLQIDRLCRGTGTVYVHVLQPNQYLPGSKPMGPAERKVAVIDNQGYGQAIAKGYPLLIREGDRLRQQGVRFVDLTMLFADVDRPIYVDPFCHCNREGNEMLARAVGRIVVDACKSAD